MHTNPNTGHEDPPFDPDYDTPPPTDPQPTHTRPGTPPHNPDAEKAVLGALLLDPTLATELATELTGTDFYRPEHETIWNAAHQLLHTGQPLDPITLHAHLATTGQTRTLPGGPLYLTTLTAACDVPATAPYYARIIRDNARLRAAQTAATRLTQQLHTATPDTLDTLFGDALDTIEAAALRFGPTTTGHTTWAPLNLDTVLAGEEVDPPPCLLTRTDGAHMLYDGAIHTLSGEPGSGKTWVALIAAAQVLNSATPDQQLITNIEPGPAPIVTMIDFEDRASRVIGRLLALGVAPDTIRHQFRYIRPNAAVDPTSTPDLEHATHDATLVILDGVTEAMTLHGLDLNANADVAKFYELLPRRIANHGPAVVMIDHVVKDNEKQGRWAIGGQHKLAGIDGVAYLVQAIDKFGRGKIGKARITVSKDRPGYVEEIAQGRTVAELHLDATDINFLQYRLDPPSSLVTDDAGNMRPTHLMERVSRYIELTPGLGKNELADGRISGKREYIKRAIDRLVQEGYVETATGPNRKQIHRSITPFREDEDTPNPTPGWGTQEALS